MTHRSESHLSPRAAASMLRICAAVLLALILLPPGGGRAQETLSPPSATLLAAPDAGELNGAVRALTFDGSGTLYAGGDFTATGSTNLNRIARWDGANWQPLGPAGAPGFDGAVVALAFSPTGVLYAGGNFAAAATGAALNRIARWDGAAWQPLGSGINGPVYAIAFDPAGNLYAGGEFSSAGGVAVNGIARWNGSNWSALGNGVTGGDYPNVSALLWDGGSLYAGGRFITAGSVTANHIARWDGATWSALGSGVGSSGSYAAVYALVKDSTGIVAAGDFPTISGAITGSIARWTGSTWQPLGSGVNGWIFDLAADDAGNLYAGGNFSLAGGASVSNIARWQYWSWSSLGAGMNAAVHALGLDPSAKLLAGGEFSAPAKYIARWNADSWSALGAISTGPRLYVKAGELGYCSSWHDACGLNEAMRRALPGSEVWVAGGTYTPTRRTIPSDPSSATFYLPAGAKLYGGFDGVETALEQRDWQANPTILDGNGVVRSVVTLENAPPETAVDGFIITGSTIPTESAGSTTTGAIHVEGGQALLQHLVVTGNAGRVGGGLSNRNGKLTLQDVTFQDNTAQAIGAGIWNAEGDLALENVRFTRNSAASSGGGIYHGSGALSLHSVELNQNTALVGGGIYDVDGALSLTDVTFSVNQASSGGGGLRTGGNATLRHVVFEYNKGIMGDGGGMLGAGDLEDVVFHGNSVYPASGTGPDGGGMSASGATLRNVTFSNSTATRAGGLYCTGCTLQDVTFKDNWSRQLGGGMMGSGALTNVVFVGNHSKACAGVYVTDGALQLTNTTLYGNTLDVFSRGSAICADDASAGAVTVANTIIRGEPATLIYDPSHKTAITYSDVEGGYPGTGNLDADPRFVDPAGGDLHLQTGSLAIDTGSSAALPPGITTDLDGRPRISGAAVDMGAYEYQHPALWIMLYLPLIMRN